MRVDTFLKTAVAAASLLAIAGTANAAEPEACQTVRISDVGWTDLASTNGSFVTILKALGYKPDVKTLGVPVTYSSMKNKDIDVFLGNWMPAQAGAIKAYLDDKSIETITVNLEGAKYTLATNAAGAKLGIKDFKDIAQHKDALEGKIYGIEPGNEGNGMIVDLIDKDTFGLKGFQVVESSEQGMLTQVSRADKEDKPVIFLAWAPHPMNVAHEITYLAGGDDTVFGPDFGGATVYTVARGGYVNECPNVGTLLKNMKFSLDMENAIMGSILNDGEDNEKAAKAWLKANGSVVEPWLAGVTTFDGQDGLAAVKKELGL
ncbi:glycine/betaine ABC transporter substrate-binding protein [Neorhizobium sp. SOG26]|jgi:choline ABC transporter, periplasmic binding protein|uniref:Choline ABC transporter substrate-binding protein n=1 Tax=Neorhizobium turbinariae TaxID=2937795 RepID=A0ABT0IKP6_9HYPH|nr:MULTISPECIES: choline ABC transporter substrate-binding protein [Neorhizobium]AXV15925.1 glycine/betaine ABC transporter substrate-binding protein [Neorhizobium sp. SOG26]MCK8778404.1 choline ABC transporter substrate-binding protein [Neorhizobium turbinariae]